MKQNEAALALPPLSLPSLPHPAALRLIMELTFHAFRHGHPQPDQPVTKVNQRAGGQLGAFTFLCSLVCSNEEESPALVGEQPKREAQNGERLTVEVARFSGLQPVPGWRNGEREEKD